MASSVGASAQGLSSETPQSAQTSSSSTAQDKPLRLRAPRSLPPWIDSYEQTYGPVTDDQLRLLSPPPAAVQPQHNSTPNEPPRRVSKDGFIDWEDPSLGPAKQVPGRIPHVLRYGRASKRGRKWDHLRSNEPVIVQGYNRVTIQPALAWQEFIYSSRWGRSPNETSEIVDPEVLDKLQPNFNRPADVYIHPLDPRASRTTRTKAFYKRAWSMVIRHYLVPLLFRLTVMITSIVALGLAVRIFELENRQRRDSAERTQAIVAMVIDSVAIPYLAYMIWDEYTGKPLGLRSGMSKISLILLDLFFIIFKSASTALAFESLIYHNQRGNEVPQLSKALAAFMLIGLICWTMNFTVNIFRTVERLGGGDDDGERV